MNAEPRELMVLGEASRAIATLRTIDEARDLRDRAEAVKAYARKAKLSREILIEASVIKARAERRLGEMLRETPLAKSSPGNQHTGPLPADVDVCTLESLGLTKSESSRLQKIAQLPEEVFEAHVGAAVTGGREVTLTGLLRLAKENGRPPAEEAVVPGRPATPAYSLHELVDRGERFGTIYADPPWPYATDDASKAAFGPPKNMSLDAICAEPIAMLAADAAHLHLWTTNDFLLDAFDVMEAWGFEYRSCFVWLKPLSDPGSEWRGSHEFLLIGVRGGLSLDGLPRRGWLTAKPATGGLKPTAVRSLIERISPPKYLEVYGQRLPLNPAWTVYGDQLGG